MKILKLNKERETILDDDDFEKASKFHWFASETKGGKIYVYGDVESRKKILLHRWLLKAKKGQTIDHIDGNTLNNSRSNLRFCSQGENLRNARKHKNCSSKFKGVYFDKDRSRWVSQIKIEKPKYIGSYDNEIEAALAYNVAASFAFKEFAKLNSMVKL